MIASAVVTLEPDTRPLQDVVDEISRHPHVQVGDATSHPRRIPVTIDAPGPGGLEKLTHRLQECDGVMFVDVVFVHFEDDASQPEPSIGTSAR